MPVNNVEWKCLDAQHFAGILACSSTFLTTQHYTTGKPHENFDHTGSTSMALEDPETHVGRIVNVSSDNPLGRAVGSNLGVFAQPLPEPVALLALTISSTNTARFSWPAHLAGWKLQQNPGLDSAGWRNSRSIPSQDGDRTELVILPQPTTWFYRLVR